MVSKEIDTSASDITSSLDNGVLTLTFNRPEARNALTPSMIVALADQLDQAETDPSIKCVVLTGSGKAFCAGGDVKAMSQHEGATAGGRDVPSLIERQRLAQQATAGKLFRMRKPTIAVINGAAAGAGLALALACDLRLMSTNAFLTTAFASVGLSGDFGGSFFLTYLVGTAKARELYFLAERVTPDEARRLGLTNWVCEPDQLEDQTKVIASRLATGPSVAFRYMKENLNRALIGTLEECLDAEATHHVHCFATADHREAVRAFVERREATFVGG